MTRAKTIKIECLDCGKTANVSEAVYYGEIADPALQWRCKACECTEFGDYEPGFYDEYESDYRDIEDYYSGAYDGFTVTSDADMGL
jgi:hypothetical protein